MIYVSHSDKLSCVDPLFDIFSSVLDKMELTKKKERMSKLTYEQTNERKLFILTMQQIIFNIINQKSMFLHLKSLSLSPSLSLLTLTRLS